MGHKSVSFLYLYDFNTFIYGFLLMDVTSFCKYIHDLRDGSLSRNEMARRYPSHPNTIKAYELDRLPDVDYLFALSQATGSDFFELIDLRLQAGLLGERFASDELSSFMMVGESVPNYESGQSDDNLLDCVVKDDSMHPTITTGATIHIDATDKSLIEGAVYAIEFNGKTVPRRIQCGLKNSVMLVSDNPRFAPVNVPAEDLKSLNVVGKVISTLNPL